MLRYEINGRVGAAELCELRKAVGWNGMLRSLSDERMTSFVHVAVYDDNKLVGYADSVSNGVTDAYIQDVAVLPQYQGRGIGSELMRKMIAEISERGVYMISVVYEPSLSGFYRRFGFYEMLSGQLETRHED